ncbi:Cro/C1-type helix-turn-helix DNA-binding protein [Chitinophaga dinghuensis]|uniref:Cro/C1-type helix-turn-helix DNA-binding protein n=1 Tax=Chitinophaga dinghuensis TaxID=1539050 RepID=A0A327VSF8_9BACT|nr:helix-turn-helix transcriptional regulator [Chitinophaga dinghuensis]RAJ78961.1 Cro/C1-type helix-turn-helix DNA-binding protein [Chitinophaga dinghuensis]
MQHIGDKVRRMMALKEVKQSDLAARLNLSQQSISRILNKSKIEADLMDQIAKALEVEVEDIESLDDRLATVFYGSVTNTSNDNVVFGSQYDVTFEGGKGVMMELVERLIELTRKLEEKNHEVNDLKESREKLQQELNALKKK